MDHDVESYARRRGARRPVSDGRSRWRELPVLAVIAVVLAVCLKTFVVQAFSIPSESMERTLLVGDRILVNKVSYRTRDPQRGDVVVFDGRGEFVGDPVQKDYVKRVIAVAGDRVSCCVDGRVSVLPAGSDTPVAIVEPYLFEDDQAVFCQAGSGSDCPPGAPGILVPPGRLWVMGDHRSRSGDSRANRLDGRDGTISVDQVVGRAFVVLWPPSRVGLLPNPFG
ncbi:MAG: signal peptidase I [Frankiales bacterium]|nr:signal peptidase I [Frankiales bacterium]